jgi:hypothetical protein
MRARAGPLVVPALLWLAHFVAVYALASLACAAAPFRGPAAAPLIFWGTVLLTGGALALAAAGGLQQVRRLRSGPADDQPGFLARTGAWLYGLAALAMAWVALPALLLPGCD